MEQFVAEQPGKHKFFEETLTEIKNDQHPNLQYFIFKSIILNNLYGVDIMNEAVEIAKLRLFLKLVATVDVNPRKDNFGLEPLPDIDFNIRAGNTLIGFATESELLRTIQKKEPLFAADKLEEFKEEFELVSKAFGHFQNSQLINDQGSDSFKQAKAQLVAKLKELNQKLNIYLATNYGIDAERRPKDFEAWLHSHQPFHWFAEFYQIVAAKGGFDCIVGNPPYVVYSDNTFPYKVKGYESLGCKDLYGYVIERSYVLHNKGGRNGMIVPISLVSTDGFNELRKIMLNRSSQLYFSSYAMRPGKLFDGVDKHLTIYLSCCGEDSEVFSSKYYRWNSDGREYLIPQIEYVRIDSSIWHNNSIPKICSEVQGSILKKIKSNKELRNNLTGNGKHNAYHTRKLRYFVQFLDCAPKIYEEDGSLRVTSELKKLPFNSEADKFIGLSCYLSNLFFWFYIDYSDCRNVNKREVFSFPFSIDQVNQKNRHELNRLGQDILNNLQENSYYQTATYKKYGTLKMQTFKPRQSKTLSDKIDTVLAEHYGFTEAELDFIINYDIKYRMGKALFGEAEDDNEED